MHTNLDKMEETAQPSIILVGNANVGKSVIFGNLTGTYVVVSNYPGTTIDISEGQYSFYDEKEGKKVEVRIIDSPGVNSLIPRSEDERVTRNLILEENPVGIIQVADAKNLKRSLLITTQLAEMGIPIILVLNVFDEAMERGINIDLGKLSSLLGVRVIPSVATQKTGLSEIKKAMNHFQVPTISFTYNQAIEKSISEIIELLPDGLKISKRSIALMLLAGDKSLLKKLKQFFPNADWKSVVEIVEGTKLNFRDPVNFIISRERYRFVNEIYDQCVSLKKKKEAQFRNFLGDIMIHPLYGLPVLLFVLFLLYEIVGVLGAGVAVDFLESKVFGEFINPRIASFLKYVNTPQILYEMLMGEYGLISMGLTYAVAIVFPIVGFFFVFFGILEDSGYLPRLTIMSNRLFKKIGLQGRAVLPMVLGLGCDTMATLTTRILETRRERVIATLLLALGVPCSAQLGVIIGMLGGMSLKALLIVVATVIIQLLIVGLLAAKVIPGKSSDFLSEIPPIRIPKIDNIIVKTFHRIVWFMKEAVPLFLLGTFCLFLFEKTGILLMVQEAVKPILSGLLSLPAETAEAFIVGFLRRDFGAAGLFRLAKEGYIDILQTTVSVTVMVLFVPCVAHLFVMIKELGLKVAMAITLFVIFYAMLTGAVLNQILRFFNVF
ncbi:MAG: ferrous iron transport protein B [Candidatus Schekmanbacteria bacterium]|nr:MAG: ferrous iron transport protein B [Candidatus Schekmanbacteria bacterium]